MQAEFSEPGEQSVFANEEPRLGENLPRKFKAVPVVDPRS
jgi:hypothetical protein